MAFSSSGSIAASTDVALNNATSGQLLSYNATLGKWQNGTSSWINVLDPVYGAKGDGTTDDTAAIQAAISACSTGGTVWFPGTGNSYMISATLVVPSGISLAGNHAHWSVGSGIKAANGSNLDALIASDAWYNNKTTKDSGITIRSLNLRPNSANQASGLGNGVAIGGLRCIVENCTIGGPSDKVTGMGVLYTLTGRDGSTAMSGTCPENRVTGCEINAVANCVRVTGNVTDAFINHNVLVGNGSTTGAIALNVGSGSVVDGNHVYSCKTGVTTGNIGALRVVNNYFEIPSAAASSGSVTSINLNVTSGGVIINNNHFRLPTAVVSGNTYVAIKAQSVTAGVELSIVGNSIDGGTQSTDVGIQVLASVSTNTCNVAMAGNSLNLTNGARSFLNSSPATVFVDSGQEFPNNLPTNAVAGFARIPGSAGAPIGTPADLNSGINIVGDTTNSKIWAYNPSTTAWFNVAGQSSSSTAMLNILDYGAVGDGTTDDTVAIQAAITACPGGGVVFFPGTGSSYMISATLVISKPITLLGYHNHAGVGTGIKAMNGSNLDALIASSAWYNNTTTSNSGIQIRGLKIIPNTANQTGGLGHGIVLSAWRSSIADCYVGVIGDGCAGAAILITFTDRDGSTVVSGSAPEDRIERNEVVGGAYGIRVAGSITDLFITDNVVIGDGATTTAISLNNGSGSLVQGNHIYSCARGVNTSNLNFTRIVDNEFEVLAAATNTGTVWQINTNIFPGGVIISGNHMRLVGTVVTGNTYGGIRAQFIAAGGELSIVGNTIDGGTQSSDTMIQVLAQSSGYTGTVSLSGNALLPSNGIRTFANLNPSTITVDSGIQFPSSTLPTNVTAGFAKFPGSSGAPTATPSDLNSGVNLVADVTNSRIWAYNPSSNLWFGTATALTSGTATLAAGTVTVANTSVTTNSIIKAYNVKAAGTVGALSVTITAGTSFTINSTSGTDTSKVYYEVVSY